MHLLTSVEPSEPPYPLKSVLVIRFCIFLLLFVAEICSASVLPPFCSRSASVLPPICICLASVLFSYLQPICVRHLICSRYLFGIGSSYLQPSGMGSPNLHLFWFTCLANSRCSPGSHHEFERGCESRMLGLVL